MNVKVRRDSYWRGSSARVRLFYMLLLLMLAYALLVTQNVPQPDLSLLVLEAAARADAVSSSATTTVTSTDGDVANTESANTVTSTDEGDATTVSATKADEEDASATITDEEDAIFDQPEFNERPVSIKHSIQPGQALMTTFVGSPRSTIIQFGKCECDFKSTDCLDAVRCVEPRSITAGDAKLRAVQLSAEYWDALAYDLGGGDPMGKASQNFFTNVFREYLVTNRLPNGPENYFMPFIKNGTEYPFCGQHGLVGRGCAFRRFDMPMVDPNSHAPELVEAAKTELRQLQDNPWDATPLQYMTTFGVIARLCMTPRPFLQQIYRQTLVRVDHNADHQPTLRVAMHLRRGDACDHRLTDYLEDASSIDSPPQMSGQRHCYSTSLYLRELKAIRDLQPKKHLVVYLATDHSRSLVSEIKEQHTDAFKSVSWRYIDYGTRDFFDYTSKMEKVDYGAAYIEAADKNLKGSLGESAMLDIFHLGYGQVFIGNLGSRFGKVGYWQAVGRHNSFVPYFSVDGHSPCCEIDEHCAQMTPFITSMENCHSIFYPDSIYPLRNATLYWTVGGTFRPRVDQAELKYREAMQNTSSEVYQTMQYNAKKRLKTWG